MMDQLNQNLIEKGEEPVAFDHDCREGICGSCSMVINGVAHGPQRGTTTCQLHMRHFRDGDTVYVEPFRARAFPVVRDLVVDRHAFDRIQQAGGYVSVNTGAAPDGNAVLVGKTEADTAFDAASCIGCGACVAACKNASAMLFIAAKLSQYTHLPQGQPERVRRTVRMVGAGGSRGLWRLHQLLRVRSGVPEEHSRPLHRRHESRIHESRRGQPRVRRPRQARRRRRLTIGRLQFAGGEPGTAPRKFVTS